MDPLTHTLTLSDDDLLTVKQALREQSRNLGPLAASALAQGNDRGASLLWQWRDEADDLLARLPETEFGL